MPYHFALHPQVGSERHVAGPAHVFQGDLQHQRRALAQQRSALQEVSDRLAYRETLPGWLRLPLAKLRRILSRRARAA